MIFGEDLKVTVACELCCVMRLSPFSAVDKQRSHYQHRRHSLLFLFLAVRAFVCFYSSITHNTNDLYGNDAEVTARTLAPLLRIQAGVADGLSGTNF
jgi:hypothetical protein